MPEALYLNKTAILSLFALCWQFIVPVLAQTAQQQQGVTAKKNGFLRSQVMSKEPDLPHFPKFSGKYLRYRGGLESSGLTKGQSFQLRYETVEKPDQVIDWYEAALKQYGYDISEKKSTRLIAMNPQYGIGALIMIHGDQPGYSPGYKTHFTVRYILQPPK